jgi:hypothetical protein
LYIFHAEINTAKMEENCGEENNKIGILQMLKIPNIFVCICCLLLMSIGWFFYEPSLAIHLGTVHFLNYFQFLYLIFFCSFRRLVPPPKLPH